jgi:hypothetical protein
MIADDYSETSDEEVVCSNKHHQSVDKIFYNSRSNMGEDPLEQTSDRLFNVTGNSKRSLFAN